MEYLKLWENKDYIIESACVLSGNKLIVSHAGWIVPNGYKRSQSWIMYDNDRFGFDFPEIVPNYLRNKIRAAIYRVDNLEIFKSQVKGFDKCLSISLYNPMTIKQLESIRKFIENNEEVLLKITNCDYIEYSGGI